eukprot:TRINITY_DN111110_c0_g1_i1.p1 TRINITY_DN111110_c0_g1~~TRINITY_DN111110_c0_g1_i1.p1  ORF type:complete len:605 (+),score=119.28 TRINITY_DN111110_c0_g1_i1:44-1858(+)
MSGFLLLLSSALAFLACAEVSKVALEENSFTRPSLGSPSNSSHGWLQGPKAASNDVVRPVFMLRHEREALKSFEELLIDISTPGSTRYGQHLSKDQVANLLQPKEGAKDAVLKWLEANRVHDISVSGTGDMIEAVIPVPVAEAMFGVQFHHFNWSITGQSIIRATKPYLVPAHLKEKLYVVGDLVGLPGIRKAIAVKEDAQSDQNLEAGESWPTDCGNGCKGKVTPAVLATAYSLPKETVTSTSMAVAEFQGVSWDVRDLNHFQKECNLQTKVTVDKQIGPHPGFTCKIPLIGSLLCTEALLDIEYIKAVAGDIPLTDIALSSFSLLEWAKQIDDMDDAPLVHSVSYGNDEVQQTSPAFMDAVNAQLMKLGARGISVLFASGDQGVYGRTGPIGKKFHPDFPAASPFVTAVGGTDFAKNGVIGEEKAWSAGGGGFSNHFAAPKYQQEAVQKYLATGKSAGVLPDSTLWNSTGRGYPDVAALGGMQNPYCISASLLLFPRMSGVAGTSASCPVVAGMIARINAIRQKSGHPPMGFLNPFLYQNAEAFNDVKLGKNSGAGPAGFQALAGWDPATGLGTPNFEKLSAAAHAAGAAAARTQSEVNVVV